MSPGQMLCEGWFSVWLHLPDEASEKNQGAKESPIDRATQGQDLAFVDILCTEDIILLFLPFSLPDVPTQNTLYCSFHP